MPKVCQLLLALAPMAQTAPGQSLATLVLCQRRREAEEQVSVEPEKLYWPSCSSLRYFYILTYFLLMIQSFNGGFLYCVLHCVSAYLCPFISNTVENKLEILKMAQKKSGVSNVSKTA